MSLNEKKVRQSIFNDPQLEAAFQLNGYVTIPLLSVAEIESLKTTYKESAITPKEGFYSTSFSTDTNTKKSLNKHIESIVSPQANLLFSGHQALGSCYLSKSPGPVGKMPLHQDWTVVDETQFDSMTIWIPLQDVNETNGAMKVIPGSHRFSEALRSPLFENPLKEVEQIAREDLKSINLKAGEAIIFSQALMHASPANNSKEDRIAVTYGLIHNQAELFFYYKNEKGLGEKYEVPFDFFEKYNTQIGSAPQSGNLLETFECAEDVISKSAYQLSKYKFQLEKNKQNPMIPIFKQAEKQAFFEKEGYLILPLLSEEEVKDLKDYYISLGIKDEKGFGFHVSMDQPEKDLSIKVRKKVWDTILPKLDEHLIDYKPFVASFVAKEPNPKGVVPAHQDWSFVDQEEKGYCSVTCWTALVNTYLDNGCMGVIKGSNNLMQNKRPSPSPQTPVPLSEHMFSIFPYLTTLEMKAGEVLFFDNRTFHASPPNTEDHTRLAVGVGVTQKDAQLVHYFLKPDGQQKTMLKYKVDEDFYLKYNNAKLAEMYDNKQVIEDYELLEELPYEYDDFSSEELVALIKDLGNDFNVPMCEKLSVLFGYDMSGKKKEPEAIKTEEPKEEAVVEETKKSFFQIYTPGNIIREVKYRITGK